MKPIVAEGWVNVAILGTVLVVFCYGAASAVEDLRKWWEKRKRGKKREEV